MGDGVATWRRAGLWVIGRSRIIGRLSKTVDEQGFRKLGQLQDEVLRRTKKVLRRQQAGRSAPARVQRGRCA